MKKEKLLDRYQKIKQEFNSVQHFSVFRMSRFYFSEKKTRVFLRIVLRHGIVVQDI